MDQGVSAASYQEYVNNLSSLSNLMGLASQSRQKQNRLGNPAMKSSPSNTALFMTPNNDKGMMEALNMSASTAEPEVTMKKII